ncbi:asparagine synthase (glutamine-hydrolyzing) [Paenibacillus sp. oral taxon 786 str. D14]|uniref:asparagine synthase (glutamine-hydrolyzing) n=3 Tax=unclassified Paenibacillus TaxID=185978 RepID=UPI0001AFCDB0|nr:asparagine synthase (glutamine-hydrolyzing) [Paenibacillus sp. oral taxon 786]EES73374.1 asparagine synthase (glutamine-hydrolyzing) [Paenibacillus sp. oral taxon 786 str. D14]
MCGIAGILTFGDNSGPEVSALRRMINMIQHRGPDQTGIRIFENIGLGFTRLSILGINDGNQPLANEDRSLWLVFNGEIYNYKSLKKELESLGHRFKTNTDSEVVLHLYEEYQERCLDKLRGMFGFAIWDRRAKSLFIVRDHFGIKPIYYYQDSKRLIFASEIKSILAAGGIQPIINQKSLLHYLTLQYVPQPETMFQGICKLEPGHYLKFDEWGLVAKKKYWDPKFEPENRPLETFVEEIRYSLRDSINLHIQSEVPVGSFLSSGIDSTTITSHLTECNKQLKTFSVGFEGDQNETIFARRTAEVLNTDHYDEIISVEKFFEDTLKAVWHMDEPIADPSAIAMFRLSKLARSQVTVALSGEGADELFGGYRIYREPGSLRPISYLPKEIKNKFRKYLAQIPFSFYGKNYLMRGFTSLEERFFGNAKIFNEDEKEQIMVFRPELFNIWEPTTELTKGIYEISKNLDDVTRMQLIDLHLWLPGNILMKADKMSMAHSLEIRVPFLDKEVFNIARKIPVNYRISKDTTKFVLRRAMDGLVPDHVLNRPKLGFPVPLRKWLMTSIGDHMLEQIIGSGVEEWFKLSQVKEMLDRHRKGLGDYSRKLWTIYIFSLWKSLYIQPDYMKMVMIN